MKNDIYIITHHQNYKDNIFDYVNLDYLTYLRCRKIVEKSIIKYFIIKLLFILIFIIKYVIIYIQCDMTL